MEFVSQLLVLMAMVAFGTIQISLVGDLGLARFVNYTCRQTNNFSLPFKNVEQIFRDDDFVFGNLETPLMSSGCKSVAHNTFVFCADSKYAPYLRENKFVVSLANNHIFNYGQDGYKQTKQILEEEEIIYSYSTKDKPIVSWEKKGMKFCLGAFDLLDKVWTKKEMIDLAKIYDDKCDWLIFSIHWGNEYLPKPEAWRVELGHELIDAGVDIIAGHHPHVWQDYEVYKDKLILYSMGNFIFDQNWSVPTSKSNITKLRLSKDRIVDIKLLPISIKNNCCPQLEE